MKILFQLGHPAHFHLFKNVIFNLKEKGHQISILIKRKDILEYLLDKHQLNFSNILPAGRKDSKPGIAIGQLKQDYGVFKHCLRNRPDLMVGTSIAISHVGKLLKIPSINVNEDDAEVVPLYAKLAYPWASVILTPTVCSTGKWDYKTLKYNGYHELSYLHPSLFSPDKNVVNKYFITDEPYFIMRFAKLKAHHDTGIKGISKEIALRIVDMLKPHGKVYITSERELEKELEPYRINVDPVDIHHVMAFAKLYIGDSQTMAAESGVLGVPFIRFNDFVGRIGYLAELEDNYGLGFGIRPGNEEMLFQKLKYLLALKNLSSIFEDKRQVMLNEKINLASFLIWFIEDYPNSISVIKQNPEFENRFK